MHLLKKIFRGLSVYGFRAALFGGALSIAFVLVFGTPESLKSAVKDSGLYEIPATELIVADERQISAELELSADDPIVQEATAAAFSSEKKQEIIETVLDGTYVWLNGDAQHPDFTIDLRDEKTMIIELIADSTFAKINSLQPCTLQQLQALSGSAFDPLNPPCKPPFDLTAEKQKFINEHSDTDEFLSDTIFSGEELLKEGERHDSTDGVNNIPVLFGILKIMPFILAAIAVITGIGVVFLSDTLRKGVRKLGRLFIEIAILLVITSVALYFILGGIKSGLGSQEATEMQTAMRSIADNLRWDIMLPIAVITALYLLVGVVILILTRKKEIGQEHIEPQAPETE